MVRLLAVVSLVLMFAGLAHAETKAAKPVACVDYSVATLSDGSKVGVCSPSKPGGKPTYLRSFEIVKLIDPATATVSSVMLGYR